MLNITQSVSVHHIMSNKRVIRVSVLQCVGSMLCIPYTWCYVLYYRPIVAGAKQCSEASDTQYVFVTVVYL